MLLQDAEPGCGPAPSLPQSESERPQEFSSSGVFTHWSVFFPKGLLLCHHIFTVWLCPVRYNHISGFGQVTVCFIKLALCLTQLGIQSIMHSDFEWSSKDELIIIHLDHKRELGACKSVVNQYMVWAVTEMLRNQVQNPDTKIHSLSLITALRHLRGAGICWILRNRYCHVIAFQKYEATPVSPAGEIDNEAGEYKFPEANHQKASTH